MTLRLRNCVKSTLSKSVWVHIFMRLDERFAPQSEQFKNLKLARFDMSEKIVTGLADFETFFLTRQVMK